MPDKSYFVVEIFPTVQGEGSQAGRRAVFVRLAGCNLWSGRPRDRAKGAGACAMWCDTKFTGGEKLTAPEIVHRLVAAWGSQPPEFWGHAMRPMVVITGGEPTLQLDVPLVREIKEAGFFVAVETNGTNVVPALEYVDHVCVSPKRGTVVVLRWGSELKVVLPGRAPNAPASLGWGDDDLLALASEGRWGALFVQPQDVTDQTTVEVSALSVRRTGGPHVLGAEHAQSLFAMNVDHCLAFIARHPEWRLSLQTHKFIGAR